MPAKTPLSPAELLQKLIRFDTTNPPGREVECIHFLRDLLAEAGIESQVIARSPERPNLLARLVGQGRSAPLLLYGHVDVVSTVGQKWSVPPFEGRLLDGWVWGRGALDMKGGVATLLSAFLAAQAQGLPLPGDVLFAAMADEEVGSEFGAKFLVTEHPELFAGMRYALSEFGGFNQDIAGRRLYPIQIAEKQVCWIRVKFHGPAGHASMPKPGGAMAKLAAGLAVLDKRRLPVRVTQEVRLMLEAIAQALPPAPAAALRLLLRPALTDFLLDRLGKRGEFFEPILHNTVCPTMLAASGQVNVIPGEVRLSLDGRLVPGARPEDLLRELRGILGPEPELEVFQYEPGPAAADMGLFKRLSAALKALDPEGAPVPYVSSAVTDARYISKLGIQTYGFTPLRLPDNFDFTATIHAADERVPVAALEFGLQAVLQVLRDF